MGSPFGQGHTGQCPLAPLGGCSAQGPSLFYFDLSILLALCLFLHMSLAVIWLPKSFPASLQNIAYIVF